MPEYQAPGVYVEEVERGPKSIEGVSTSTAGFLGETERGPTDPKLVTSFADYQRKYGGIVENRYLTYAIDGFFRNGGSQCFVGRIASDDAVPASATLADSEDNDLLDVQAVGPGTWGNNVAVIVDDATLYSEGENQLFKVTVRYWSEMTAVEDDPSAEEIVTAQDEPTREEVYDNVSPDEASSNYYGKIINGVSNFIELSLADGATPGRPATGSADSPAYTLLTSGTDGTVDLADFTGGDNVPPPGERTGLPAFEEIDEISIVCIPDEHVYPTANVPEYALTNAVKDHCENMEDRFAVLQAKQSAADPGSLSPPVDSSYAAFYYPWIKTINPETNMEVLVPPGGHVTGIYARSDSEHGVHKAPANEIVRGARELQFNITKGDQKNLNPKGVNCIRSFPGRGIRVWGARTTSSNTLWKYVNVRRLFLYVEESIDEGTQWVVFESNDEQTWARVRQTIRNFLIGVWDDGALMGTTPEEAFYVKCDRTTMTQDDIDNGRLICEIGIAPVKPAEFVIFRISQWTGGAET